MFNTKNQNEIPIQRPYCISQVVGLAKLIEAKLKDSKPKYTRSHTKTITPLIPNNIIEKTLP